MKAPDQSVVDANFAAKMEARRNKTAPVMVTAPTLPAENPNDPSAVDTRYRAKLAAHKKALEAPAIATAPAPAPSVETPDSRLPILTVEGIRLDTFRTVVAVSGASIVQG